MQNSPVDDPEDFYHSLARNFRTPLRSISGFSDILVKEESQNLSSEGRDYLNRIVNSTRNLSFMVDGILNLSLVKHQTLEVGVVSLSNVVRTLFGDLQYIQPNPNIELKCAPDLVVKGDYMLLKMLIHHLLGNAWKFMKSNKSGEIEFGVVEQDSKKVYFIRDNGIGFQMEEAQDLFTLFHRLPSAKNFGGVGVGLAMARQIVQKHKGRIWYSAHPDLGAQFFFTLEL